MRPSIAGIVVPLALALIACGPQGDDQETGSVTRDDVERARASLEPAVLAALDSGNAAYRAGSYEDAKRHYSTATRAGEDVAAAWFGLYMAELALGDTEAAEAAMERARGLAPGASLIHPTETDSVP